MRGDYVHGYGATEGHRLEDQARTLEDLLHAGTSYPPESEVLEAGCGVGAQTMALARRSPGARITAVDLSAGSLAAAAAATRAAGLANVAFAQADLLAPPFAPGRFDHAFVCFVLEHLARPVEVLRGIKALLKPGGTLTVIEGDHGSTLFHPESEAARAVIQAQVELQRRAGGDALIGRRLHPLLREAGLADVRATPRMVYADASRPDFVEGFIRRTFTAMIAGIREPALAAGLLDPARFDEGIRGLERTAAPDGTFGYTFFKAVGRA